MKCDLCNIPKQLYLYTLEDFIYAICKSCLSTQLEIMNHLEKSIERVVKKRDKHSSQDWELLLNKIANREISKDDLRW